MGENFFIKNSMEEESQIIKEMEKRFLKEKENKEADEIRITMAAEHKKIVALDVLVIITILLFLIRFVFFPLVLKIYPREMVSLYKVLRRHFKGILENWFNILLFLLFIGLLVVYFMFDNTSFKHMGLILIIAYVTSLAVEAQLFITGAVLNAIIVFIYIRILLLKNKIEQEREDKSKRRLVDR